MAEVYHGGTIEKKQNYCVMSIILFGSMLIVGGTKKGSVLMILENRKKKRPCVNSRGDKARIFYYDIYACNCTELLCFDDYVLQAYNLSIPDFKF